MTEGEVYKQFVVPGEDFPGHLCPWQLLAIGEVRIGFLGAVASLDGLLERERERGGGGREIK